MADAPKPTKKIPIHVHVSIELPHRIKRKFRVTIIDFVPEIFSRFLGRSHSRRKRLKIQEKI